MELADPLLIESLLARSSLERTTARRGRPTNSGSTHFSRRRRCACGICSRCIENARWDRIFNEKFADPDYYQPQPIRVGSSLGWLR